MAQGLAVVPAQPGHKAGQRHANAPFISIPSFNTHTISSVISMTHSSPPLRFLMVFHHHHHHPVSTRSPPNSPNRSPSLLKQGVNPFSGFIPTVPLGEVLDAATPEFLQMEDIGGHELGTTPPTSQARLFPHFASETLLRRRLGNFLVRKSRACVGTRDF